MFRTYHCRALAKILDSLGIWTGVKEVEYMKRFGVGSGKPIIEKPKSLVSKEKWSEEGRLDVNHVTENGGNSRRKGLNAEEKEVTWN